MDAYYFKLRGRIPNFRAIINRILPSLAPAIFKDVTYATKFLLTLQRIDKVLLKYMYAVVCI